jgi:hypothetical protein
MVNSLGQSLSALHRIADTGVSCSTIYSIAYSRLLAEFPLLLVLFVQDRNIKLTRGAQHSVALLNLASGLLPDPLQAGVVAEQAALITATEEAKSISDSLYLTLPPSSDETALYTELEAVWLFNLRGGSFVSWDSYSVDVFNVTLMNALGLWSSQALLLAVGGSVAPPFPNSTSAYFVVVHGTSVADGGLQSAMNASLHHVHAAGVALGATQSFAALAVLVISLLIFALLATCVVMPAVAAASREKHLLQVWKKTVRCAPSSHPPNQRYPPNTRTCQHPSRLYKRSTLQEALLDVPANIFQSLDSQSATPVGASSPSEADAVVGGARRGSINEHRRGSLVPGAGPCLAVQTATSASAASERRSSNGNVQLIRALAALRQRAQAEASSLHVAEDEPAMSCCASRVPSSLKAGLLRPTSRYYRGHPWIRFCVLLGGLLLPLAAYCSFYAGTFLWRTSVSSTAASFRNEVMWLRQMEEFAARIASTERLLMQCNDPVTFSVLKDNIAYATSSLQWLQGGVLNGDSYLGTRPTMKVSADMLRLWCVRTGGRGLW